MSQRWKIFWVVWLACLAPVLWLLSHDDGGQISSGKPIAHIVKVEGGVTVRSERRMIWEKAKPRQDLYNNDLIATEDKSRATIEFEEGRRLQLTPGSVVKVSLSSPLSKDHEVSVLKGRLLASKEEPKPSDEKPGSNAKKKDADDSTRLIVKNANEKIEVANNAAQEISAPKQAAPTAAASLDILKKVTLAALPPPAAPCIKEPTPPPPEPEKKPEAKEKPSIPAFANNLLPQVQPSSGEFWTAEPFNSVTDQAMRLDVDIPNNIPKDVQDKWKGIVNISGPNGHIRVDSKASSGHKKLSLTLKDLMAAKVIQDTRQASFAVNSGYSVESDDFTSPVEYTSQTTGVYNLRSLAEGEGIMIGFDKLVAQPVSAPWLFVTPRGNKRIWIGVTEPEDRKKLFALVQGNGGEVARADWPGIPAQGAYIVRADKIVGIVSGSGLGTQDWEKIRRLFNADLIFSGSSQAYINRSKFDITKTNERTLYVLKGGEFVEIDVSLLRNRPNTMRFVQGLSSYLFREQPKILSLAH